MCIDFENKNKEGGGGGGGCATKKSSICKGRNRGAGDDEITNVSISMVPGRSMVLRPMELYL